MTFQFSGGFLWTKVLPLHLHLTNDAIPKRDLPQLEDIIRFHQKISFGFHCTSFQLITWVASCTYFFNTEMWKTLWTLRFGGRANWYDTCPILDNISKGPQYRGASLAQLPNLRELFLGLTLIKTCSPTWNSFGVRLRFAWLFCRSCTIFKLPWTYFTINSICFNNSGPNTNLSTGLLQDMGALHFLPYRILKGLYLAEAW